MSFLGQNNFFLQRKSQSKAKEEKDGEEGGSEKGRQERDRGRGLLMGFLGLLREPNQTQREPCPVSSL